MSEVLARRATTLAEFGAFAGKMFVPAEIGASIAAWKPRRTDVVISPYGKCGTTWLQQIFHTLRTGGDLDFDDISRVVPWIETATALGIDIDAPQRAEPRGFKSHLPYDAIPKGAKAICSLRDPKDAMVSMYRFMEGWMIEPGAIPIDEFARNWMGRVELGSDIWNHLLSWWAQRDNPDVLLLSYEGMSAEPERTIRRVAAFIGVPLTDELLALTLERSSIGFMLAHKDKFADPMMRRMSEVRCGQPPGSDSAKVRQGGSGSGLKELPAGVIAELDAKWAEIVTPKTGFADYAALEAAVRAL
jgi:hypothetical protein